MYAAHHAVEHPDRPAFIMASTGHAVSYAEFEARSNQLAHLLAAHGLGPHDHYSVFMENNDRYFEACAAGERSGMYYTCINSYLTPDEMAYIVDDSESQVVITSAAKLPVVIEALPSLDRVSLVLVVGGVPDGVDARVRDYVTETAHQPTGAIERELLGVAMLYSSGTTGQPKGIIRELPEQPPSEQLPLFGFLANLWQYRDDMIYLSPAPLYHSAPQAAVNLTIRQGGTAVVMERFDPLEYLQLIERHRVTHSQLVPTMFSRMLKLPAEDRERFDLSSLEFAVHAAAPCPVQVKEQMIEWWGPIIHEYYGATEGLGFAACDSEQWLAHRGTVGKIVLGEVFVADDDMNEMPNGTPGTLWFGSGTDFQYHNDPAKTAEATSSDGTMTTVNDVGYVDDDGFLYLTDRKTFMIISGGVNIYPQETENLLITHPKVADAAVFGIPNEDLGEEVKAVVQPMPGVDGDEALARELTEFCAAHLARQKVPRSIDFDAELPRLPTGKLYKRVLRDRYWGEGANKIV
ncbi:MAG: AMP-binding protein [Ilumatobacter sp.]